MYDEKCSKKTKKKARSYFYGKTGDVGVYSPINESNKKMKFTPGLPAATLGLHDHYVRGEGLAEVKVKFKVVLSRRDRVLRGFGFPLRNWPRFVGRIHVMFRGLLVCRKQKRKREGEREKDIYTCIEGSTSSVI